MLLTITTTHNPATDLGYLLHKNPERMHSFELSFGKAHLFYPEATPERCTVALLLDVDPVGLVRGKRGQHEGGTLDQYVNDRPYVLSSFLSVAMGRALSRCCTSKSVAVMTISHRLFIKRKSRCRREPEKYSCDLLDFLLLRKNTPAAQPTDTSQNKAPMAPFE